MCRTAKHNALRMCASAIIIVVPANAHGMLKCRSPDGSVSYASERHPVSQCVEVGMPLALRASGSFTQKRGDVMGKAVAAPVEAKPVPVVASIAAAVPRLTSLALPPGKPQTTHEAQARIYAYLEDGVRHYTSRAPLNVSGPVDVIRLHYVESCYICSNRKERDVSTLALDLRSFNREIEAAARVAGVDVAIVRAVIHAESAFRPNVVSRAGAQGLMQLMPMTARQFGVTDSFDAAQNIGGGVRYLAWLFMRYNGDMDRVLAGFNAGAAAVDRYGGIPPYAETEAYVARVKALTERYRSAS